MSYTSRKPANLSLSSSRRGEKPLPNRPVQRPPTLPLDQSKEVDVTDQRRPSIASTTSTIVLTPLKPNFSAPAHPPRLHLPPTQRIGHHNPTPPSSYITSNASKTLFYRTDSNLTSSTNHHFPGMPQTPHSLDYTNTKTSTLPLIPLSEKTGRKPPPNFFRRHWFVITVAIATLLGISLAIVAVMIKRNKKTQEHSIYVPVDPISPSDDTATSVVSAVVSLVSDVVSSTATELLQPSSAPL